MKLSHRRKVSIFLFHTRYIKIWRDITTKKTRTALVTISVFVGVLAVVALTTVGSLLSNQLQEDLQPSQMAMLRIYVDTSAPEPVDNQAVLEKLREQPSVTVVEGQAVYEFAWRRADDETVNEAQLYSYSQPFGQMRLDPIRLFNGRFPIESQNEIAIEQRMAEHYDIKIDDQIEIRQADGNFSTFTVTGIIFQPYIYIGSSPQTSAYINYRDAQSLIGFKGYSSIFVRFSSFPAAIQNSQKFRKVIADETPYKINFYLIENPSNSTILVSVQRFSRVLRVLAMMAMLVSSFLITNNIVALVSEQRRQIGVMKALGATRLNILTMYLGVALFYGILGTVPAVVIGIPLGQAIADYVAPTVNTIIRAEHPPLLGPALGIALGLGVPLLTAFVPAYNASNLSILEAFTNLGLGRDYRTEILQRILARVSLPLFFESSLNNIFKNRWRVALTGLTLTLAVTFFMSILTVITSLNTVLESRQHDASIERREADLSQLDFLNVFTQLILTEQDPIREFQPGVAIELQVSAPTEDNQVISNDEEPKIEETPVFIMGIDTHTDLGQIALYEGDAWEDDPDRSGIVISTDLSNELGLTVGDYLHIRAPDSEGDFEIIGINDLELDIAIMNWEELSHFVGTLRDAPIPNAYWEKVQVYSPALGDDGLLRQDIWVIGIDEQLGNLLSPNYNPSGILISEALAEETGSTINSPLVLNYVAPGDDLFVTLAEFSEDVAEEMGDVRPTYFVSDVVTLDPSQMRLLLQFAPEEVSQQEDPLIVAMDWAELADVAQIDYRDISPKTYYIDLDDATDIAANLEAEASTTPPAPAHSNQLGFADSISQTIFSLAIVMNTAALFMAIIGGIGLLTTNSMNVHERQREIGVMRSVGASSKDIIMQFYSEGVLIGIICWLMGIPLSYYLGDILLNLVPFKEIIHYHYTLFAPVVGFIGIVVIASAASIYPAVIASRKTISEILRY